MFLFEQHILHHVRTHPIAPWRKLLPELHAAARTPSASPARFYLQSTLPSLGSHAAAPHLFRCISGRFFFLTHSFMSLFQSLTLEWPEHFMHQTVVLPSHPSFRCRSYPPRFFLAPYNPLALLTRRPDAFAHKKRFFSRDRYPRILPLRNWSQHKTFGCERESVKSGTKASDRGVCYVVFCDLWSNCEDTNTPNKPARDRVRASVFKMLSSGDVR